MRLHAVTLLIALGFLPLESGAQSLPDLGRQERSRQTQPRQGRVFTNENIPDNPGVTIPKEAPTTPDDSTPTEEPTPIPVDAETENLPAPADRTEEQWRGLFEEARVELVRSEELVTLTEQELADLNQQLLTRSDIFNREQIFPPLIQAKEQELAEARDRVEQANVALAELQTELRQAGRPAGWARP